MPDKKVTLKQVIEQVLSELNEPIAVTDLADRVYAIYPTRSKTAMSSFRNCLHYDEQGVNLVYLDKFTILPMRIAMQGVRFRVPVDRHAEKEHEIPVLFFNLVCVWLLADAIIHDHDAITPLDFADMRLGNSPQIG